MKKLKAGFHRNIDEDTYHRIKAFSASKAGLMLRSPKHYKAAEDKKLVLSTAATRIGRAVHCAILEKSEFKKRYYRLPDLDFRFKDNREIKTNLLLKHKGKTELRKKDMDLVYEILAAVKEHRVFPNMIKESTAFEATCIWKDKKTGIMCKSRIDSYMSRLATAFDIKNVKDASPRAFSKQVAQMRWDMKAAVNLKALESVGQKCQRFLFVAIEKSPPYCISVYELPYEVIHAAYQEFEKALDMLRHYRIKNEWPEYVEKIDVLQTPSWRWRELGLA